MNKRKSENDKLEFYRNKIKRYENLIRDAIEDDVQDGVPDDSDVDSCSDMETVTDENDPNISNIEKAVQESEETTDGEVLTPVLSGKTRELLGVEKRRQKEKTFNLHPELAECWKEIILMGMEPKVKKSMEEKYTTRGNCPVGAPELNTELLPLLHKTAKNRDRYLAAMQEMGGRGLVALGSAICAIFNDQEAPVDRDQILEYLCDASSIVCEVVHQLSKTRKHQIYQHVDERRRIVLEQSETDKFLFGEDLSTRIKSASAAEKVGLSLKTPAEKKRFFPRQPINWKGSSVSRGPRQTSHFNRRGSRFVQNARPSFQPFRQANSKQTRQRTPNSME